MNQPIAKPVVKNKFWVVEDAGQKIADELSNILNTKPEALRGFAGRKTPNAGPLKVVTDVIIVLASVSLMDKLAILAISSL